MRRRRSPARNAALRVRSGSPAALVSAGILAILLDDYRENQPGMAMEFMRAWQVNISSRHRAQTRQSLLLGYQYGHYDSVHFVGGARLSGLPEHHALADGYVMHLGSLNSEIGIAAKRRLRRGIWRSFSAAGDRGRHAALQRGVVAA
jgi:hypothetical protein